MIRNALLIILAIICFCRCTMAPRTPVPRHPSLPNGRQVLPTRGLPAEQTGPAAVEIGWREFYVDEKLQKVIGLALSNNRDLRIAALNIEKARALYRIQRAELFPAIDASGSGPRQGAGGHLRVR